MLAVHSTRPRCAADPPDWLSVTGMFLRAVGMMEEDSLVEMDTLVELVVNFVDEELVAEVRAMVEMLEGARAMASLPVPPAAVIMCPPGRPAPAPALAAAVFAAPACLPGLPGM